MKLIGLHWTNGSGTVQLQLEGLGELERLLGIGNFEIPEGHTRRLVIEAPSTPSPSTGRALGGNGRLRPGSSPEAPGPKRRPVDPPRPRAAPRSAPRGHGDPVRDYLEGRQKLSWYASSPRARRQLSEGVNRVAKSLRIEFGRGKSVQPLRQAWADLGKREQEKLLQAPSSAPRASARSTSATPSRSRSARSTAPASSSPVGAPAGPVDVPHVATRRENGGSVNLGACFRCGELGELRLVSGRLLCAKDAAAAARNGPGRSLNA